VIVQLLGRNGDPDQDVAGACIGLFQRIGELIDLGDGDTMSFEGPGKRFGFAFEFGEGSLDQDTADDEA
jgi:hypothetical protein